MLQLLVSPEAVRQLDWMIPAGPFQQNYSTHTICIYPQITDRENHLSVRLHQAMGKHNFAQETKLILNQGLGLTLPDTVILTCITYFLCWRMITLINNEHESKWGNCSVRLTVTPQKQPPVIGASLLVHLCLLYWIKDFKAICSLRPPYLMYLMSSCNSQATEDRV